MMCCEYNAHHEFLTRKSGKYTASGRDTTVALMTLEAVVERYGDDVTLFDARGMERRSAAFLVVGTAVTF